jgi:hypothetical protein
MENKNAVKVLHFVSGLRYGGVEQILYNYYLTMDRSMFQFDIVYQHSPKEDCLCKFEELGCNCFRIPSKSEHPIKNLYETY